MSPIDSLKREEKYFYERFCELSGRIVDSLAEQLEPPAPDIVFRDGERKIGLEITRIVSNQEDRRVEEELERLLAEAQSTFEGQGGPPLLVAVFWSHNFKPKKSNRRQLVSGLVNLVLQNNPNIGDEVDLGWHNLPKEWQSILHRVGIHRWPKLHQGLWQNSKAAAVPEKDESILQDCVTKKEKHVTGYRSLCNEVWFLIVAETNKVSSWWELNASASQATYRTSFDRVFVLADWPRRVVELRTASFNY
ncbi:MAG: hypothetical protein HZA89_05090 [Verrucomicrobia bacterium]|nr:hypothetical protein [Verrucomicrobiota bacterium]